MYVEDTRLQLDTIVLRQVTDRNKFCCIVDVYLHDITITFCTFLGGNVNTAEKLLQLLHEFKLSYVTSERLESLKEIISDDNTTSTQASSGKQSHGVCLILL